METIALIALAFLLGAGEPTKEDVVYSPSNVTAVQRTYNPSATRTSDIIHTDLAISFDWQKQYLHGTAHITARPYFEATNKLTLDAKGFDIHKVTKEEKELAYFYENDLLTIHLGKRYTRKENMMATLRWKGLVKE